MARKYPGCAEQAQREIYRWMREALSAGKHVVRLKIGDPFIFGRGGEEVLEMRRLGVEPKVVPGISSVFSAPLLGGVPVTHRGVATQVRRGVVARARRGIVCGVRFEGLVLGRPACVFVWCVGRRQGWLVRGDAMHELLCYCQCYCGAFAEQKGTAAAADGPAGIAPACVGKPRTAFSLAFQVGILLLGIACRCARLPYDDSRGGTAKYRVSLYVQPRPCLAQRRAHSSISCVIQSFRVSSEQKEQVTLGTGYGQDYARPDICDYHPQKTAVFLMAIGRLEELCEDLVRRSYPRDTPVVIVENASTPRQR